MPAASGRAIAPAPGDDWFSDLFGFAETSYEEAQRWLRVVPGTSLEEPCRIESLANGASYSAGNFSTPSLAELRARGQEALKQMPPGKLQVSNELGDVSKKHVEAENRFATFQVASQFNCLELWGLTSVPKRVSRSISSTKLKGLPAPSLVGQRQSTETILHRCNQE